MQARPPCPPHFHNAPSSIHTFLQDGSTPLHEAARVGEEDVAALLLDRGAAIEAKEKWVGCNARMWLCPCMYGLRGAWWLLCRAGLHLEGAAWSGGAVACTCKRDHPARLSPTTLPPAHTPDCRTVTLRCTGLHGKAARTWRHCCWTEAPPSRPRTG